MVSAAKKLLKSIRCVYVASWGPGQQQTRRWYYPQADDDLCVLLCTAVRGESSGAWSAPRKIRTTRADDHKKSHHASKPHLKADCQPVLPERHMGPRSKKHHHQQAGSVEKLIAGRCIPRDNIGPRLNNKIAHRKQAGSVEK